VAVFNSALATDEIVQIERYLHAGIVAFPHLRAYLNKI
jgi:hypothetical protein